MCYSAAPVISLPMARKKPSLHAALPSVDSLLKSDVVAGFIDQYGRAATLEALRESLGTIRAGINDDTSENDLSADRVIAAAGDQLVAENTSSLRALFNLTGTVLHTNLGRAPLPEEAIEEVAAVSRGASNLEFDIASGKRGDRDNHIEDQLCRLTGAEAATVVNNNAAAVMLVLNSLALRKEVPTSRGELIEIGGAFRIPDIMARAGCKLREVGTTNRTHLKDFAEVMGSKTGMVMKIHTSNYEINGFTAAADEKELAALCHENDVPFAVDLGSGTLVDLEQFGLPHEPTPAEAMANGADVVTFSGDKLLGGPQAGIIVGKADMIARIKRNPMKRALRLDKMTIAALSAVLRLYRDPDRLVSRIPALRALSRDPEDIRAQCNEVLPTLAKALGDGYSIDTVPCDSQVGSGALPTRKLPSAAIAITPETGKRGRGSALKRLAAGFRALPVPVIGRIQDDAFILDLRCLEDRDGFEVQLSALPGLVAAQK